jgi:bifunctional enzyme CysN/CysC
MAHAADDLVATDIGEYLRRHENKSMLRFITCGSVDDGKSTLIGRLLYDAKLVFADHLEALEADSKRIGTQGDELDFALLVDGLAAEREQGITIDVAYRFFTTERRKFIVADTPGHEQYTRNMVTGASTAELAVILVDARKGVVTQTRRHSFLVSLLGIRHVVVAVNKLDLVDYSEEVFAGIEADYRSFADLIGINDVTCIPISALNGDNVTTPSSRTPFYDGPTLLEHLEAVEVGDERNAGPLRLPVQWVNRPNLDFRGFSGQIAGGSVRPGDQVRIMPAGTETSISRIVTADGDLEEASSGQSVTVTLADEVDVSRGDVITNALASAPVGDQFECRLIWMGEEPMLPGRPYFLKIGTKTVGATVTHPKFKINVNTLEHEPAPTLGLNEIGVCNISTDRPISFDPYVENRDTGGFILIDRYTNATVGAGLISFELRRSQNVHWQTTLVDRGARARLLGQQPRVVWFTGLSGAGKSTIASLVERRLFDQGFHTYLLDGDNLRHGLNRDVGFTSADRVENVRRAAEVARILVDAGIVVLASFISPFRAERRMARDLFEEGQFIEVHVDIPLAIAEGRDHKGLYAKARRGELTNFTGIDSPYESPEKPELHLDAASLSVEEAAASVVDYLLQPGILGATPGIESLWI